MQIQQAPFVASSQSSRAESSRGPHMGRKLGVVPGSTREISMANYKGIWRSGKAATDVKDHGHQGEWQDGEGDDQQAKQNGAVHGQGQDITDEEASEIGNLMNAEDDPEGWMSELVDYWEQLPPTSALTRKEWLQHRLEAAKASLAAYSMGDGPFWPQRRRSNNSAGDKISSEADETQSAQSAFMPDDVREQKPKPNHDIDDGGGLAHA
jgi:hypothetical protein